MSLLEVKNVSKKLEKHTLLEEVGFKLERGEKLGIVGETGSGKTTILKIIAGLIQPTSGKILFKNEKVLGPDEQLIAGHPKIGYLSQHFELPKFITVEDHLFDSYKISEEDVEQLYVTCDIEHLIDKDTQQLSGGEKQRVALARILRDQPELLLLDEPFSNLDLNHQRIIKDVLNNLEETYNTTLIIVSHDPQDVLSWADKILVMRSGAIVQLGSPKEMYYKPKNTYVAGLFGEFNLLKTSNVKVKGKEPTALNGSYMIRPGDIKLYSSGDGIKTNVVNVRFLGSHDEVTINIDDQKVKVLDVAGRWKKKDQVIAQITCSY